ncbi:transcriptional regulator PpsR [Qipengyuania sp. 6B39]|uniref:transcriptional regulator PpsR n=1 Tax=Qipengyuania proteolytica TaxID=2867239 RepID=UPI001C89F7AC|nr:transcriptional regulator PpsR [Qipengyuania proteolytica]MBX7497093.1 transcriptional regulator PpsR [Qipengyuania proteolytica]
MLTRKHSIEGRAPFGDSADVLGALDLEAATRLAMVAGDITLIVDDTGRILDASANPDEFPGFGDWVGRDWLDTVTVESKPKIMEMLAGARKHQTQHWRQVNHVGPDGDVPVKYVVVPAGESGNHIAFGRDLRETAAVQQRLLQAQQSLERDYLRMRRLEARYRMLFDLSSEAVLIVAADGFRIKEANPAAHRVLGTREGKVEGGKLLSLFGRSSREPLIAYLGAALTSGSVSPFSAVLQEGGETVSVSATGFRQQGGQFLMLRLARDGDPTRPEHRAALDVLEAMPDAFVLTDDSRAILAANLAFVELIGAASIDQIRGRSLGEFVGRPGIDLDLIDGQLAKHGFARNVTTVVGANQSMPGEPVELSAVQTDGPAAHTGFVIRQIGRRLRNLAPVVQDEPRSVEQLTELVGRMSLKEIVRESTDLIERLCIEAALTYTSDNRASAAEILGLSRQSLYSKLHRYGLGNLESEAE